jgi:hypothetical protein
MLAAALEGGRNGSKLSLLIRHGSESGLTERIGGKKKESSWLRRHPEDSDAELFGFNLIVITARCYRKRNTRSPSMALR